MAVLKGRSQARYQVMVGRALSVHSEKGAHSCETPYDMVVLHTLHMMILYTLLNTTAQRTLSLAVTLSYSEK